MKITTAEFLAHCRGDRHEPRSINRAIGGRLARAHGESFESIVIASQHDQRGDVVTLFRIPEGARWIGANKIIPQPSPCDFAGTADERGIFFDAKSVGTGSAFSADNPKILKRHQAKALCRLAGAGAIAGVLVNCSPMRDIRWIDGRHLMPAKRIRWDDQRWMILGSNAGLVPFRRLIEHYTGATGGIAR